MKKVRGEKFLTVGPKKKKIALSTVYPFIQKYGMKGFNKLLRLLADETNTNAKIGKQFNVTSERVRQWLKAYKLREAFGDKDGWDRKRRRTAKDAEANFTWNKVESKIAKRAEEQGFRVDPWFVYNAGRWTYREVKINGKSCLAKQSHTFMAKDSVQTKYARYRPQMGRHPNVDFFLIWVPQLKQVAVVPVKDIGEQMYLHFRLNNLDQEKNDDSHYLENWDLLRKKRKTA